MPLPQISPTTLTFVLPIFAGRQNPWILCTQFSINIPDCVIERQQKPIIKYENLRLQEYKGTEQDFPG